MLVRFAPRMESPHPVRLGSSVGDVTLGAAGMLGLLETQLGLPPVLPEPGEVLFVYRACLAEADDLARFYHASFVTDPVGTTRTLASWRARWYEAGWDGEMPRGLPQRLIDMGEVEKRCRGRVPLTRGERLMRVARALAAGGATSIDRIELHTQPEDLAAAWRAVLDHFEVDVAGGVWPEARAPEETDLGRVQRRLRADADASRRTTGRRERLSGDGTVFEIAAVSRDVSAQAVAEYLLGRGTAGVVVLAERDGIVLDNALERVGLPRAGFQHYTAFRGVTQVLRLVLALAWQPLSPELLLQFLSHPVGPLPRRVRGRLAEAVAAQPGIGGRRWRATLDELSTAEPAIIEEVDRWLGGERFDPRGGAPALELATRTKRVRAWLLTRLAMLTQESDRVLYAVAIAQADGLTKALERLSAQSRSRIPKVELDLILDEVTADAPDPGTFAHAGHTSAASRASQITQPFGTVIWWDPVTIVPDVTYPWSAAELEALRTCGVALPLARDLVSARAREWLRPILNATDRLILAVHTREEGRHPVLGQIEAAFDGVRRWRAEQALLEAGPAKVLAGPPLELAARELVPCALPIRRRWWQLPNDVVVAPREGESYSSLRKLFDYPHEWVLRYAARLRPGRAAELAGGALLFGNLAHALMEWWFSEHAPGTSDAEIRSWFAERIPLLLQQEGATLLAPGAGVERQRVVAALERALVRLVGVIRDARIQCVEPELDARAPFADTTLSGSIDLLLTDVAGRETVVDVKWGGEQWRRDELAANRQLQLATYAYLRRQASGRWPAGAFFIVSTANLLVPHAEEVSEAIVVPPVNDEGLEGLWSRMAKTYAWRREQIAEGRIEVAAKDTLPDAVSLPPLDALQPRNEPDRYDDYAWLTGCSG